MPFSDLTLKVLDEPGWFEVVGDCHWRDGRIYWTCAGPVSVMDVYTVPSGFKTDLASIPWGMRNTFSQIGRSRKPAVFHDHMYGTKWRTRKECDQSFREMLIERGIPKWKAYIYYLGVRLGGWTGGRGNW